MKKKVLIDLYMLKYPNCGFGQIALNYGKYFKEKYIASPLFDIYLLVPPAYVGAFGNEVKYIKYNWWMRHFPRLLPFMDVWHSTDQRPRFKPYNEKTKYILTIHDFNYEYEKNGLTKEKYRKNMQALILRANQIICISNFTKSEAERYVDLTSKKIDVILNGVEFFDEKIATKPAFVGEDEKYFFTIGEVREKKNFQVLLDMMKLMPDKTLFIAGNQPTDYAKRIQKRITDENITNVHLVGKVSNGERIWLYKNCEAFVFPSLFEGFGLPIIEAMQFGKPVFSSQETSLKEIGGNCAFFWDNFSPEHMKSVVENGLRLFEKEKSLEEKNRKYAHRFSYEANLTNYIQLYQSLMEG
jgi:glycosyltransferase involved in cell wall biosynthesis